MFAEHGTVNSCIIMRDDEGKSKVRPFFLSCGEFLGVLGVKSDDRLSLLRMGVPYNHARRRGQGARQQPATCT